MRWRAAFAGGNPLRDGFASALLLTPPAPGCFRQVLRRPVFTHFALGDDLRVLTAETRENFSLFADEQHPFGFQFLVILLQLFGRRRLHGSIVPK